MAINKKPHFRGSDFNNQELKDAKSLQLNQDAVNADEAVRKSQTENIADQAAQDILVNSAGNASLTTAFTSQTLVSLLAAKQDNLSIHADSTAYAELVGGTELKFKQLLLTKPYTDTVSATLADYLVANPGNELEEGDFLILTQAVTNQERTWVHNGGSAGDASDFTKLVTDYNQASIRAMLSSGDTYINYDAGAGQFSLNRGLGAGQLGAQTLPADSTQFSVISGSTAEALLVALEVLIIQVDNNASGGTATTNTRLSNLSGVSGNNLESFNGSTFSANQNVKQVLQQSENKHESADSDRAAIRGEVATTEAALANSILTEKNRALGAEASEASARQFADNVLQANINSNVSAISSEASTRHSADVTMSARLDVVENDSSVVGSIEHAKADALAYTDNKVALEATARQEQDAVLNLKIDNLAEGDITFVGELLADGTVSVRSERIASGDTRNGQALVGIDLAAGETFIAKVNLSLTYTDNSVVNYEAGDKIMLVDDVASGSLVEAKVNAVPANVTGLSLINIGSSTIEIDGSGYIRVIADSITRNELAAEVEADIDDKRSLTADNAMTSNADTHIVTDTTTGAAQNMYYKRTSNTSDALTGTKRTQLAELYVGSSGSANPLAPNFAHTGTWSTHYTGTSIDMSMAVGGGNFEANVVNPNSAVFATGVYALAQSQQLGINSAVTGVAQNAGVSNIGITGFGKAGGIGKDRGGVFALSDLEFLSYAGYRAVTPISYPDVALLADAGTSATGKALVAIGDTIFEGGSVTVPSATTDVSAVNLGDVKAKEYYDTKNISANNNVVINHGLGSKKLILSLWLDDEEVTSSFDIEKTSDNSVTIYNGSIDNLIGIEVCIMKLSV